MGIPYRVDQKAVTLYGTVVPQVHHSSQPLQEPIRSPFRGWFRDGGQQLHSKEFRWLPELLIPVEQVAIGSLAQ